MHDCFIAMPITTPDPSLYHDDSRHFIHVMEHLFIPAIRAAGLNPISPIAQGAELIHAEIIRNIEECELVLCDVSTLNANVFFELGIRTALNKPVCIVKDDLTARIPFDTTIINHHTYASAMQPWVLNSQVPALTEHIKASLAKSAGKNALWKYFGLVIPAQPAEANSDVETRLGFLSQQMESLTRQVTEAVLPALAASASESPDDRGSRLMQNLSAIAAGAGYRPSGGGWGGNSMSLKLDREPSDEMRTNLERLARMAGFNLVIQLKGAPAS